MWLENSQSNAMKFIQKTEQEMDKALMASSTHMPENNSENRGQILNHLIDGLIGMLVGVIAKYGNASEVAEHAVIESIKYKFEYLRGKNGRPESSTKVD